MFGALLSRSRRHHLRRDLAALMIFACATIFSPEGNTAVSALEYDCMCECCLPGTCELGTREYKFNVGDPALCTTNMCASNVQNCPDSGSHNAGGTNIATYADCSCACCKDSTCPTLNEYAFHAGGIQQCTPSACSSKFYSCPDPGTHSANSENFATFYDCTCGCADTPSESMIFNRFYAGTSTMCTRNECESRFTTCKNQGASVIEAWFAGAESESEKFDSSPWQTYNDGKVRISIGGKTVTLSKGAAAGIAAAVLFIVFSVIGYFGYRLHQRRRGYRWMVFDQDEEGRMLAREVKGSSDVEMSSSNNNNNNGGNAENVVQISSLRAQHAAATAAAAAAAPPSLAPPGPQQSEMVASPNYTRTAPTNVDDQMSPYRVD